MQYVHLEHLLYVHLLITEPISWAPMGSNSRKKLRDVKQHPEDSFISSYLFITRVLLCQSLKCLNLMQYACNNMYY